MTDLVILVCPCCASTVEAEPGPQHQQLSCLTCHQQWQMVVDRDRHAEFSLS